MSPSVQSSWAEWRTDKEVQYQKAARVAPRPNKVLRPNTCSWCWGSRMLYEAIKIDKVLMGYVPVVCRNCDGHGATE